MFVILSIVDMILLVCFVMVYRRFTHIIYPLFFAFYYFIFFLVRPYGQIFYQVGLDASYPVMRYSIMFQIAGILFLGTLLIMGMGVRSKFSTGLAWPFAYPIQGQSGYLLAFLLFFVVSYAANIVRFKDFLYPIHSADIFASEMSLANGSWFINILAGLSSAAALAWFSSIYSRISPWKSFLLLCLLLLLMIVIGKESARTSFMIPLLAWVFAYPGLIKKGLAGAIQLGIIGYLCLVFMMAYGILRAGRLDVLGGANVSTALLSAFNDTRPSDNALLVFDHFHSGNYMHFKYLAGAVTPACLIPSKLVPFRPSANKDEQLTNEVFPNGIDTTYYHEGSTLTFTVPVSGYADAGWIGLIVSSVLYGAVYLFFARLYSVHSSTRFLASYFLLGHITSLRLSTETCFVNLYTWLMIFLLFKLVSRVQFRVTL